MRKFLLITVLLILFLNLGCGGIGMDGPMSIPDQKELAWKMQLNSFLSVDSERFVQWWNSIEWKVDNSFSVRYENDLFLKENGNKINRSVFEKFFSHKDYKDRAYIESGFLFLSGVKYEYIDTTGQVKKIE